VTIGWPTLRREISVESPRASGQPEFRVRGPCDPVRRTAGCRLGGP
jgi:hypothetical protein